MPLTHTSARRRARAIAPALLLAVALVASSLLPAPLARAAGVIYVRPGGGGDGSAWAGASDLVPALAAAVSGDQLWVAAGTYRPTTTDPNPRNATFQLKAGVAVYGGFAGDETQLDQRDWASNIVTLSGDIGSIGNTDNSYHVVTGASGATLDGVIISGGHADPTGPALSEVGGGMFNNSSSPTLSNITFAGNYAGEGGGGLYNGSGASPILTNVTFSNNTAYNGGGMYNEGSTSPVLGNVIFSNNSAVNTGGGMYNANNSSPILTKVTFSGNSAPSGGGIYNTSSSSLALTNVVISGNSASFGGGIYSTVSSMVLSNVTISGNSASTSGGGLASFGGSLVLTNVTISGNNASSGGGMYNQSISPQIRNSIIWGNSASVSGPAIYNSAAAPVISSSLIEGSGGSGAGWTGLGADGGGNLDADPLFVAAVPGPAPSAGGNLRLRGASPAVNAGNNSVTSPSLPATDLGGGPRIGGGRVDMGAYELAAVSVAASGKLSGAPSPGLFVISSDRAAYVDLPVSFSLAGSMAPGADYIITGAQLQGGAGSAVIPAGTASVTLTITLDRKKDTPPGSTLDLALGAPGDYVLGAPAQASLAVMPVVAAGASGAPSRFGPVAGSLTLTRTGGLSAPLTVPVSLAGGAQFGVDYTLSGPFAPSTSSVTFPTGAGSVVLTATPAPGSQPGQSIGLTIRSGDGYVPGAPISAGLTIDGAPPPPWLVLLYMAGDDVAPGAGVSLSDSLGPLLQRLPYNPNMRLVILYDGNVAGDSHIYVRERSGLRDLSALWPGGFPADHELDTGSFATLQSFISWARTAYPGSPHTMLSIIDHGGGWAPEIGNLGQRRAARMTQAGGLRGMGIDQPSGNSLSTRDTGRVLAGLKELGRFDVIFFDACLMGMVESAYEVAPYTGYLVAGENLLWSAFPYERYFDPDRFTATTAPRELASLIVAQYNEPLERTKDGVPTEPFAIAAIDTSQLPSLINQTEQMARDLYAALPTSLPATPDTAATESKIRTAYAQAQKFDYDGSSTLDPTDSYVDLAHLAQLLAGQRISSAVSSSANAVAASAQRAIITKKAVSGVYQGLSSWDFANANGLSIYMPLGERDCRPTGVLRAGDGAPAALSPCIAPLAAVNEPTIEPQLDTYYARPGQLNFIADAPAWARLLLRLDPSTPARIKGAYRPPMPAGLLARVYLPMLMSRFDALGTIMSARVGMGGSGAMGQAIAR